MRGRHAMRRRNHVRAANNSRASGFLPGDPRGCQAGRAVYELRKSHGDEHLGVQPLRRRKGSGSLPRRAGRTLADRALH